jgi:ATP-dependent Lon protease
MAKTKPLTIPIIPLSVPAVLLPGTTLKIPITNRADIAAILANLYSRAASPSLQAPLQVGCVPLNSPYLSPDGKKLIENGVKDPKARKGEQKLDAIDAKREDLFRYGCLAKVSGVYGQREGVVSLIVEGLSRFEVRKVGRERPFFEGDAIVIEDEGTYGPLAC